MELWIATGNKGKLEEYKLTLGKFSEINLFSQADLPHFTPRPEDGATFLDNARIKAKSVKALKNEHWVLGEDAGLEVEGLNHLPGVHTARYAGPNARDSENVAKVLKMVQIRSAANRKAQFKCVSVVLTPNNEEWVFEGLLKGQKLFNVYWNENYPYMDAGIGNQLPIDKIRIVDFLAAKPPLKLNNTNP
jgi:XTP/dITP diphosphohydrolase